MPDLPVLTIEWLIEQMFPGFFVHLAQVKRQAYEQEQQRHQQQQQLQNENVPNSVCYKSTTSGRHNSSNGGYSEPMEHCSLTATELEKQLSVGTASRPVRRRSSGLSNRSVREIATTVQPSNGSSATVRSGIKRPLSNSKTTESPIEPVIARTAPCSLNVNEESQWVVYD